MREKKRYKILFMYAIKYFYRRPTDMNPDITRNYLLPLNL